MHEVNSFSPQIGMLLEHFNVGFVEIEAVRSASVNGWPISMVTQTPEMRMRAFVAIPGLSPGLTWNI